MGVEKDSVSNDTIFWFRTRSHVTCVSRSTVVGSRFSIGRQVRELAFIIIISINHSSSIERRHCFESSHDFHLDHLFILRHSTDTVALREWAFRSPAPGRSVAPKRKRSDSASFVLITAGLTVHRSHTVHGSSLCIELGRLYESSTSHTTIEYHGTMTGVMMTLPIYVLDTTCRRYGYQTMATTSTPPSMDIMTVVIILLFEYFSDRTRVTRRFGKDTTDWQSQDATLHR